MNRSIFLQSIKALKHEVVKPKIMPVETNYLKQLEVDQRLQELYCLDEQKNLQQLIDYVIDGFKQQNATMIGCVLRSTQLPTFIKTLSSILQQITKSITVDQFVPIIIQIFQVACNIRSYNSQLLVDCSFMLQFINFTQFSLQKNCLLFLPPVNQFLNGMDYFTDLVQSVEESLIKLVCNLCQFLNFQELNYISLLNYSHVEMLAHILMYNDFFSRFLQTPEDEKLIIAVVRKYQVLFSNTGVIYDSQLLQLIDLQQALDLKRNLLKSLCQLAELVLIFCNTNQKYQVDIVSLFKYQINNYDEFCDQLGTLLDLVLYSIKEQHFSYNDLQQFLSSRQNNQIDLNNNYFTTLIRNVFLINNNNEVKIKMINIISEIIQYTCKNNEDTMFFSVSFIDNDDITSLFFNLLNSSNKHVVKRIICVINQMLKLFANNQIQDKMINEQFFQSISKYTVVPKLNRQISQYVEDNLDNHLINLILETYQIIIDLHGEMGKQLLIEQQAENYLLKIVECFYCDECREMAQQLLELINYDVDDEIY